MPPRHLYNFIKKYSVTKPTFVVYCAVLSGVLYFFLSTLFGEKGLVELWKLKSRVDNREAAKQELMIKMQVKKNMVEGMNSESLDVDLLDEQARKTLGYAGKNEVVVYQE